MMIKELMIEDRKYLEESIELRYEMQFEEKDVDEEQLLRNRSEIKENIRNFIDSHLGKDLFIVGMIEDEHLVATSCLQILEYYPEWKCLNGKKGYITNVYTLPKYRKRGYQRQLMMIILDIAEENQIEYIKLSSQNLNAIHLYESLGFIRDKNAFKIKLTVE